MNRSSKSTSPCLFLSYSRNDSELANKIDKELNYLGFEIKRDIRDIGSWKSIRDFMSSIRNQDFAIMIISSSYLKSANCMYEVMELLKNSQYKKQILSIVTADANIYNPISRAMYIKYWEEETKKLEEVIKPLKLENIPELSMELRKYKSIEITIASFLDLISDTNNPNVVDAVEKIKEVVKLNTHTAQKHSSNRYINNIEININACHYAILKFAETSDIFNAKLKNMVGIKKLKEGIKQDVYDLPMLQCEIINCSEQERIIQEPMISGAIKINGTEVEAIGFMQKSELEKRLEPGAKAVFILYGPILINIIEAMFEDRVESIHVEDNFGFIYYASVKQIEEATEYFKKYCRDLAELREKHKKYCI